MIVKNKRTGLTGIVIYDAVNTGGDRIFGIANKEMTTTKQMMVLTDPKTGRSMTDSRGQTIEQEVEVQSLRNIPMKIKTGDILAEQITVQERNVGGEVVEKIVDGKEFTTITTIYSNPPHESPANDEPRLPGMMTVCAVLSMQDDQA